MVPGISSYTLDTVYKSVRIGMDVYKACLYAQLTDEQIEQLDADPEFTARIRYEEAAAIHDILVAQDACMKGNLRTGQSTESRWLLSKLDRKRYGNGPVEFGGSDELPPVSFSNKGQA